MSFFFLKMCFFHCFISVFILFVFLLLRFYDCGSSYAHASGNKTLHGPMLLESRLFCSHVLRSLCFFLTINCVVRPLEICKNNVRLNALIYAQLLQLPTNFTIQLCFFARKIGSVLCRVMQRECFGRTNLTMPSFVRNIVIAHELRSDQQYSARMAQHDTIPYSDI